MNEIQTWIHDPKTEPEIFINEFMMHAAGPEHAESDAERMRSHFRAGYCWHFAHILKAVFNRGEVCWAAPFGHMVWQDTDGIPYDIEGIYDGEARYLIPERYFELHLDEFKHVYGMNADNNTPSSTKAELIQYVKAYCADNNIEYDAAIEKYFEDPKQEVT